MGAEADLDELLNAWRATRAEAVADAVDRISAELTSKEKPLASKAAWWAAFESGRSASVERLLEAIPAGLDRAERLAAFAKRPDPRVGTFARRWLVDAPVSGKKRGPFFLALATTLEAIRDPRVLPVLHDVLADRTVAVARCGLTNYKHLVALANALAKVRPKPLPQVAVEILRRLRDAPPPVVTTDPAELFARVYADPSDDGVRAVLADLLTERGDPRGEFINLQLARAGTDKPASAAEKRLEKTWSRAWLGAIEPAVLKSDVVFERGFPTSLRLTRSDLIDATLDAPEWGTVVMIDVARAAKFDGTSGNVLIAPALKNLRHVLGMNVRDLIMLESAPKRPWETVGFSIWNWSYAVDLHGGPFPNATRLVIENSEGYAMKVDAHAVATTVARFPAIQDLDVEAIGLAEFLATKEAARLRKVTFRTRALRLTFERATNTLVAESNGERNRPEELAKLISEAKDAIKPAHVRIVGA